MKVCICSFCAVLCFSLSLFFSCLLFSRFAADRSPLGLKHLHGAEKSLPLGPLVAQRGCTQEVSGMWVAAEGPVSPPRGASWMPWLLSEMPTKPTPGLRCLYCPCHAHPHASARSFLPRLHPPTHVPAPTPFLSIRSTAGREGGVQSEAKGLPRPGLGGSSLRKAPSPSSPPSAPLPLLRILRSLT